MYIRCHFFPICHTDIVHRDLKLENILLCKPVNDEPINIKVRLSFILAGSFEERRIKTLKKLSSNRMPKNYDLGYVYTVPCSHGPSGNFLPPPSVAS